MNQINVTNTFNIDSITDSSDINDLSEDDETFYFKIIEEDDETSDCVMTSSDPTSTINETVYSNDITSLNQIDIDNIISSIVEDKDQSEDESELEEIIDCEKLNSNISPNKQKKSSENIIETVYLNDTTSLNQIDTDNIISSIVEDKDQSEDENKSEEIIGCEKLNSNISQDKQKKSTENIDSVIQHDIVYVSSDSDENTEESKTKQTEKLVNLTAIHFIKNKKSKFRNIYYRKEIYTKLINFLNFKTENEIVNTRARTTNGYELHVKDLMTVLTPATWLNDSVIQNFISLLVKDCDKTLEMNTDFLNCYRRRGYDSVYKWFKKCNLINFERIVVPINPGNVHWALLIIELWEGKIYFFDSYPNTLIEDEFELSSAFLDRAIIDYIKVSGVERTGPKKWQLINGDSPKQTNKYDCGVFTCMNARYFLLNTPPEFQQRDIPILRQIIAWELINNTLEIS